MTLTHCHWRWWLLFPCVQLSIEPQTDKWELVWNDVPCPEDLPLHCVVVPGANENAWDNTGALVLREKGT